MKTIAISEFENLVARNDWQRKQEQEIVDRFERQKEEWDEESESFDLISIPHVLGWASKISTLEDITIVYEESFSYDEYDPDSLLTGTDGLLAFWSVNGVVVVDEYGDRLNADELAEYLDSDFNDIDFSGYVIEQITDIDVDEESDMETFTLEIDNAPNVRFTGELVARVESSDNRAMSNYSGQTGCWTELFLYKTKGGKFICHKIGHTRWVGGRTRFRGKVCETMSEVKEFFGHCWLAEELYTEYNSDT